MTKSIGEKKFDDDMIWCIAIRCNSIFIGNIIHRIEQKIESHSLCVRIVKIHIQYVFEIQNGIERKKVKKKSQKKKNKKIGKNTQTMR